MLEHLKYFILLNFTCRNNIIIYKKKNVYINKIIFILAHLHYKKKIIILISN
jgi:hypothetical protein